MIEDVLTEQQESTLEQIKAVIYYSDPLKVVGNLRNIKIVPKEETSEITRLSLDQTAFEQSQRRLYLMSSLYERGDSISLIDQEAIVSKIAQLTANSPIPVSKTTPLPNMTVSQEIIDQAKLYVQTQLNIDEIESSLLIIPQVVSIYRTVSKQPSTEVTAISESIKSFIDQINRLEEKVFDGNLSVPKSISDVLEKIGLSAAINKYDTLGQKLAFLGVLLLICETVIRTTKRGLTEDDGLRVVGKLMRAQGISYPVI